jgi:hypothetical protein
MSALQHATNLDGPRTRRQTIVKPSSSGGASLAAVGLEQSAREEKDRNQARLQHGSARLYLADRMMEV